MEQNVSEPMVRELMADFADRTGLSPGGRAPRRYLWTDAFALCNFLELYRQSGEQGYRDLALRLVDQVHQILGRHREDDPRTGWISGLDEQDGQRHPTAGGLRIGKELGERRDGEPLDERLEWDRDGQYYHYLTKWMHALGRVSRVTADPTYNAWAMELAKTAHARFTYVPFSGAPKGMYWKMSIDLARPLVTSMGQHDPLDGLLTCSQLQMTARDFTSVSPDLGAEIADLERICQGRSWATEDPLGIGGLLCDAGRMAQLMSGGAFARTELLCAVLDAALLGLESVARQNLLSLPADYRLPFRELGLSIGLRALERLQGLIDERLRGKIDALMPYMPLREMIEAFWLEGRNRSAGSWLEHREINMVMLATSLAPDGFVTL